MYWQDLSVVLQCFCKAAVGEQRDTKHSRTKHMHNLSSLKPDHGGRLAGQTAADQRIMKIKKWETNIHMSGTHSTTTEYRIRYAFRLPNNSYTILPLGFRTVACCCGSLASDRANDWYLWTSCNRVQGNILTTGKKFKTSQ